MIKILVTGVGSLLGQGIIKSLAESKLKYRLIGTDYFASAIGLYWVDKGYFLPDIIKPEVSENEWVEVLIDIIKNEKIEIVIPGLDFEIPLFAKYKETIEELTGSLVVVSSQEVVSIGNDKWETVKFLKEHGFNYPKSCLSDTAKSFLENNSFPMIVKPRFGHTSENVFLVKNKSQLFNSVKKCDKPIIQEYLGEKDREYTCGVTCVDNQVITLISLRRTLKNGNTQQAFCEKTDEIDQYIKKLTLSLKPYGPINFQLRLMDKGPVVFEINPRFSGTTPIRALFGVNEVEAVINKLVGEKNEVEYTQREGIVIRYFENQFIPLDQYMAYFS